MVLKISLELLFRDAWFAHWRILMFIPIISEIKWKEEVFLSFRKSEIFV